jgi:hypothetical protein
VEFNPSWSWVLSFLNCGCNNTSNLWRSVNVCCQKFCHSQINCVNCNKYVPTTTIILTAWCIIVKWLHVLHSGSYVLLQAIDKLHCGVNVDATMVLGAHLFSDMSTTSIEMYWIPNTKVIAPLPHDLMWQALCKLKLHFSYFMWGF